MFLIDKVNRKAMSIEKRSFSSLNISERHDLQEWIVDNPMILGERLLVIQKEFAGFSDTKERLDLLAIDENGNLVVIENKLDDSGKDVVWQALKYVSYCATLTKADVCDIYQSYLGEAENAKERLAEFFDNTDYDSIRINPNDGDQRIIFVAANFRKEVTSTVLWLRDHGVDITCIEASMYHDGNNLYLDTDQILPIKDIGDYQIRLSAKKQEDILSSNEEAARVRLLKSFWEAALPTLRRKTGLFANVSPSKDHWLNGTIGITGIEVNPVILKSRARAELYIDTGDKELNKQVFAQLFASKNEYQKGFDAELYWQELPDRRACRVYVFFDKGGLRDVDQWGEIAEFFAEQINRIVQVFRPPLLSMLK